jgi:hypothetical protein
LLAIEIVGVPLLIGFLLGAYFCFTRRSRRRKEQGFHYVYINDDGSARELDDDEKEYLNSKFHGADGARPYIKFRYESLTPDGRIGGYLERRQLPSVIEISPISTEHSEPKERHH